MVVHCLQHPLVQHKLTLLRGVEAPPKLFRELRREVSALLASEATRALRTTTVTVQTPLAPARGEVLAERIGLVPILRAGLGMVDGVWSVVPTAEVWPIGLYRDDWTLRPVADNKLPDQPTVDRCLVLDPLLATGGSAVAAVDILKRWGVRQIAFLGLIAAPEGLQRLTTTHPAVEVYLAAIDERLNERGFIVPGLGDAGDRLFGTG